jgi:hypothetical protein
MTRRKGEPETAAMPMERELQALIGHRLRARYAEVLAEPIPDKFLKLLEQLDTGEDDGVPLSSPQSAPATGAREEQRR